MLQSYNVTEPQHGFSTFQLFLQFYNVTKLQSYNLVKGIDDLLEWKEKQARWKLEWKRRKVVREINVKIVLI